MTDPKTSLLSYLRRSLRMVDARVRWNMIGFALLLSFSAVLELVGLSLIFPIAAVLGGERGGAMGRLLGQVEAWTGLTDPVPLAIGGAVFLVTLLIIKALFALTVSHWANKSFVQAETRFIGRLYAAYLASPKSFHDRRKISEIMQNLATGSVQLYRSTCLYLVQTAAEMVVIVGVLVVLVVVDPIAALVSTLVMTAAGAVFVFVVAGPTHRMARELYDMSVASNQILHETLQGLAAVQTLGRQGFFVAAYYAARAKMARVSYWQQTVVQAPRYVFEIFIGIMVFVVIVALAGRRSGAEVLGVLALYGVAAIRLVPAGTRIVGMVTTLRSAVPGVARLEADMRELDADVVFDRLPWVAPLPLPRHFVGTIELHDVDHQYDGGSPVLRNVKLTIARGQSIGLVGESGAGKSTLAGILLGLIAPTHGCVLFDGRPVEAGEPAAVRSMGYVPQHVFLFDTTIRRNIALGLADAMIDDGRLKQVLRDAQLEEFVANLPDGLDTRVGEHGTRVSGGQRQRIGIARATYLDPDILVLDEATSALDVETEARFAEVVRNLRNRKTLIIIAHRLSTIRACDRLIFLKDGYIVGDGAFDELVRTSDEFARLVAIAGIAVDDGDGSVVRPAHV